MMVGAEHSMVVYGDQKKTISDTDIWYGTVVHLDPI